MNSYNKYKSIAIIDVSSEEKRRRQLQIFDVLPIWRWLWCQLVKINIEVDFLEMHFSINEQSVVLRKKYDLLLVYIEHYIPEWLSSFFEEIRTGENATDIFLCGFLPTIKMKEMKEKFPFIDNILTGPLEVSLMQLCDKLYSVLNTDIVFSQYPKEGNLSDNLQIEYKRNFLSSTVGIIQSSIGCPKMCHFCRYSKFYHQFYPYIYKQYPMQEVVEEIKKLVVDYNVHFIKFMDSNLLGSGKLIYKRAYELANALKENDLHIIFAMHCRSDSVTKEVINILAPVGLKYISMGIESMSIKQLERFGKQEIVNTHWEAVNILKEKGIFVQGYGILADPLITRDELLENLQGLYKLSQEILIVLNEKMILYTMTNYYKNYEKLIPNKRLVESSLGVVVEYDFSDEWCSKYFRYIEETSIWLQQMAVNLYRKMKNQRNANDYMKRAASYRLEALITIANMNDPDDFAVEKIKNDTIEKIRKMR